MKVNLKGSDEAGSAQKMYKRVTWVEVGWRKQAAMEADEEERYLFEVHGKTMRIAKVLVCSKKRGQAARQSWCLIVSGPPSNAAGGSRPGSRRRKKLLDSFTHDPRAY